jgi:predicted lactoylglutathione lyase
MARKIFVNLPVKDLNKSKEFFTKLGFSFDAQYSDDSAACMVISDDIYAMLLTRTKFKEFTPKKITDAKNSTEVLTALSFDSKDDVNRLVETALKSGATETRPAEDYGFMFGRSFNDPDGHIWEAFWMDPNHVNK